MPVLNRDAIMAFKKLRQETVAVPEWGGDVIVRELKADEADMFEASFAAQRNAQNGDGTPDIANRHFRAKIVALSVIDEDGKRVFTDEDVATLGEMSRAALDRVSTVAMRLSGYSEDTKKNSQDAASSASASPSS